jgi:hypothetical protein
MDRLRSPQPIPPEDYRSMKRASLLAAVLALLLAPSAAFAWGNWKTLKTRHFVVFYREGREAQARRALEALESHLPVAERLTGNRAARIPVVIEDAGDYANGWSDALYDNIHLFASPPRSGSLGYTQDWWAEVGVHETIHTLHQSRAEGVPGALAAVLGNAFLPNVWTPTWLAEGLAVLGESQLSPYQGRLNDGFYHACLAAALADGRPPGFLAEAAEPLEFPQDRAYVYGGLFFAWLSRTYGQDRFARFIEVHGSSILSYVSPLLPFLGIDAHARRAFGKPFSALWKEWLEAETEQARRFVLDGKRIGGRGWYVDGLFWAEGRLYHQRTWPEKTGPGRVRWFREVVETDPATGTERVLASTASDFAGPLRVRNGKLCYAVSELRFGMPNIYLLGFGLGVNVHETDLATGEDRVRLRGTLRAFDLLPDGTLIGAEDRRDAFGSRIVSLREAGGPVEVLFETDVLVDQLAADGRRVVAVGRGDGENFGIHVLDPKARRLTRLVQTPFQLTHAFLQGDRVFFAANFDRTWRIYAYDFRENRLLQATRGSFATMPAADADGRALYFAGLTSRGFDLRCTDLALEPFSLPTVRAVRPARTPLRDEDVEKGGYLDNLATLWPKVLRTPTLSYDPDKGTDAGVLLAGGDALGHFRYTCGGGYNFKTRKARISLDFETSFFAPLLAGVSAREDRIGLDLGIPLVWTLDPGIQVLLAAGWRAFERGERNEIEPRLTARFALPSASALLELRAPLESTALGSTVGRAGLLVHARVENYLFGEFIVDARLVFDPDNPRAVFPSIRGYPEALPGNSGAVFTLEYSHAVLPLRGGIWNPTIYFEDVCVAVFLDAAIQAKGETQVCAGLEIRLEMKILNAPVILFTPGVRGLVTQEGEARAEPILEIAIGF